MTHDELDFDTRRCIICGDIATCHGSRNDLCMPCWLRWAPLPCDCYRCAKAQATCDFHKNCPLQFTPPPVQSTHDQETDRGRA